MSDVSIIEQMHMDYGYIRVTRWTTSKAQQLAALRGQSATLSVVIETAKGALPYMCLHELVGRMGSGDRLIVSEPNILGGTKKDILGNLDLIAKAHAGLLCLSSKRAIALTKNSLGIARLIDEAITLNKARILKNARSSINKSEKALFLSEAEKTEAATMWHNLSIDTQSIAARYNVTSRTLYRAFGARRTITRKPMNNVK
jgi:hypothetical protein